MHSLNGQGSYSTLGFNCRLIYVRPWNQSLIHRRGKSQFSVGLPRCTQNSGEDSITGNQGFDCKKPNWNALPTNIKSCDLKHTRLPSVTEREWATSFSLDFDIKFRSKVNQKFQHKSENRNLSQKAFLDHQNAFINSQNSGPSLSLGDVIAETNQHILRVSMGLTDRRTTAKNLADSRKNWKILTVSRKYGKKELTVKETVP